MIHYIRLVLLCLTLLSFSLFSSNALADPWKFEIAPYAWALNMNGHVSEGPVTLTVNQHFTDLLEHLDGAGMLYASAHKNAFGFYFNGLYSSLSNSQQIHTINTSGNTQYTVLDGGVSYIVFQHEFNHDRNLSLEPYAGVRYTNNNTKLTIGGISLERNVDWIDPVVGMRFNYSFNKKWLAYLIGDIGGTSSSTQYSYSAGAFLGYQPKSWNTAILYLGYRILDQYYQTGSGLNYYNWNMKLFGPVVGLGCRF